jgi:hypothetical protein
MDKIWTPFIIGLIVSVFIYIIGFGLGGFLYNNHNLEIDFFHTFRISVNW